MDMETKGLWVQPRSVMSEKFLSLLDKLEEQHKVQQLHAKDFDGFKQQAGLSVVLTTDDPDKVPESWDMAVIFPDLLKAMPNVTAGVFLPGESAAVIAHYGIKRTPTLLFLRNGEYVGVIEGLRDWSELVQACQAMLDKPVSRVPSIGIAIKVDQASGCHTLGA